MIAVQYPGAHEVASVVIGGENQQWCDRHITISTTPDLPFNTLKFEGVNPSSDLTGFCLDDMTITLVPEPSSLLALAGGLGGVGLWLCKRVNSRR